MENMDNGASLTNYTPEQLMQIAKERMHTNEMHKVDVNNPAHYADVRQSSGGTQIIKDIQPGTGTHVGNAIQHAEPVKPTIPEPGKSNITSIDDLKKLAGSVVLNLPPFIPGTEFRVEMRRPSLLQMIKNGTIPNNLMNKANSIFFRNQQGESNPDGDIEETKQMLQIMEVIAREAFVNPKYDDIIAAGITLTDAQLMYIFNYVYHGVAELGTFRNE